MCRLLFSRGILQTTLRRGRGSTAARESWVRSLIPPSGLNCGCTCRCDGSATPWHSPCRRRARSAAHAPAPLATAPHTVPAGLRIHHTRIESDQHPVCSIEVCSAAAIHGHEWPHQVRLRAAPISDVHGMTVVDNPPGCPLRRSLKPRLKPCWTWRRHWSVSVKVRSLNSRLST